MKGHRCCLLGFLFREWKGLGRAGGWDSEVCGGKNWEGAGRGAEIRLNSRRGQRILLGGPVWWKRARELINLLIEVRRRLGVLIRRYCTSSNGFNSTISANIDRLAYYLPSNFPPLITSLHPLLSFPSNSPLDSQNMSFNPSAGEWKPSASAGEWKPPSASSKPLFDARPPMPGTTLVCFYLIGFS